MQASSAGLAAGGTELAPTPSPGTPLDIRLRDAERADVPFIVDAMAAESRRGHFVCDPDQPGELQGLWRQVETVIATGMMPMPDARHGVGGQAVIALVGGVAAGFGIVVEHLPGTWDQRVEILALAVHPRWRGHGVGSALVRTLTMNAQSDCVYARCAPASQAMHGLLTNCGFIVAAGLEDGGAMLEFHRAGY